MLGFIVGTVCLVGLVKMLRHGRGWHGCGPSRYGYGYDHDHDHGHGMRGGRRRWFLRSIFERLDTTPGQEKAIVAALDELRKDRKAVRSEIEQSRADMARAVALGLIDDGTLEETFARHDRLLAQLRVSFVEALKKVTETLDERQHKAVASVLEGGLRGFGRGFRGPWA